MREQNPSSSPEDDSELDPLQPIKRRRIASIESTKVNYNKRIMCRPPIRRMRNN